MDSIVFSVFTKALLRKGFPEVFGLKAMKELVIQGVPYELRTGIINPIYIPYGNYSLSDLMAIFDFDKSLLNADNNKIIVEGNDIYSLFYSLLNKNNKSIMDYGDKIEIRDKLTFNESDITTIDSYVCGIPSYNYLKVPGNNNIMVGDYIVADETYLVNYIEIPFNTSVDAEEPYRIINF